jgi:Condensation domain/TubC N-terminal docking domain
MQDLKHFLISLRSKDIHLWTENGELQYRAPRGILTKQSMEFLRANRKELIELLRDPTLSPSLPAHESDVSNRLTHTTTCIQSHMLAYYQNLEHPEFLHTSQVSLWEGELDVEILQRSLDHLVARHDALRCRFSIDRSNQHRMYVDDGMTVSILTKDLRAIPDETAQELEAREITDHLVEARFDPYRGPLVRLAVLRLRNAVNAVVLVFHHVIFDRISLGIAANELPLLYERIRSGCAIDLPPVRTSFLDFVREKSRWFASGDATEHTQFWEQRFRDAERPFWLPHDEKNAGELDDQGPVQGMLPAPAAAGLANICSTEHITFQSLLTASFALAIGRWARKNDVCMWVFTHGRQNANHFGVIGCFMDTWPLRLRLNEALTTRGLLRLVNAIYFESRPHIDVPSQHVAQIIATAVGHELDRATLFNYIPIESFSSPSEQSNLPSPAALAPGFRIQALNWTRPRGHLESINGTQLGIQVIERVDSICWNIHYDPAVFRRSTISSLSESVCSVLESAANDLMI